MPEQYSLEISVKFDPARGFCFVIKSGHDQVDIELPAEFINVAKRKGSVEFCSLELLKINSRIRGCLNEVRRLYHMFNL